KNKSDLVYVNYGTYDDFLYLKTRLNLSLSGKIGLARYGSIFRGSKVKNAEAFKFAGLILYPDPINFALEGIEVNVVYPNTWWMPESDVQRGSVSDFSGDPMTRGYPSLPSMYREMPPKNSLPSIPVYPISYSDAWHLLSSMDGAIVPKEWQGGLNFTYKTGPGFIDSKSEWKVKLEINLKREKRPIYNVIGRINGDIEPDRYVIIGNHRDAWTYGGSDPVSGTACMLEISRVFALLHQNGWYPRRTIIFASWDAEEFGLVGSTEYVEENMKVLKERAIAYINVDNCVTGNHSVRINASPLLSKIVYEVSKMIPNPDMTERSLGLKTIYDTWLASSKSVSGNPNIGELGSGSDFFSFMFYAGVTSMDIRYMNIPNYPLYHTRYDTFYNVHKHIDPEFIYHKAVSQLIAILVHYLSDSQIVPLSPASYGDSLKKFYRNIIKDFGSTLEFNRICMNDLMAAITYFDRKMTIFQNNSLLPSFTNTTSSNTQNYSVIQTRSLNDKLMLIERGFSDTYGLPHKPLLKHLILAPSNTDHNSWTGFPALNDLLYALQQLSNNSEIDPKILTFWVGDIITDWNNCKSGIDYSNDLLSYTSPDLCNFTEPSIDLTSSTSNDQYISHIVNGKSECKLSSFLVEAIKKHTAVLAFTIKSTADFVDD
ncbi:putative N-acetylated-alpha-linked acidic dipeptidase, partial [Gordionus sp. m RMFG-2023]|uniref:putative N-acetylated-alpha-linked acidic dipeptidase n=1 Tax=Gordionus sp. m RMFG-2023 TaxID=3053472 RepID=UPI0031FDDE21